MASIANFGATLHIEDYGANLYKAHEKNRQIADREEKRKKPALWPAKGKVD